MVLFNSFTCLVVFSCNSLRDFCVSYLRASSYLSVFSSIFLKRVIYVLLKVLYHHREKWFLDLSLVFPVWCCTQDLLCWENCVLMMPSNLNFCCLCSYACLPPSDYLKCSLPSIYLTGASPSCNPRWVGIPQSPAFSVILWFWDPVNLRSWVCQSTWQSSFLWDHEILVWPSSWDPGNLCHWLGNFLGAWVPFSPSYFLK